MLYEPAVIIPFGSHKHHFKVGNEEKRPHNYVSVSASVCYQR